MPLLLDAHVHFHPCFDRQRFLDRAAANFAEAARSLGASTAIGGLLLTESTGADFYGWLTEASRAGRRVGGWSFAPTTELGSLIASHEHGPRLVIIAGRQVVTNEGLEVLALACVAGPRDGGSIAETIESVHRREGLSVIPWGFGKWWLERGRIVERLLDSQDPRELFLGDNGSRPRWAPRPRLFRSAERCGFRVLPGSDPLPFPRHGGRAGSSGFLLQGDLDLGRPAAAIREALYERNTRPAVYGGGVGFLPFVIDQLAMQWRKRRSVQVSP